MHVKSKKHPSHFRGASSKAAPRILPASNSKAILHFTLLGGMSDGRNAAHRDQGDTDGRERTHILDIASNWNS